MFSPQHGCAELKRIAQIARDLAVGRLRSARTDDAKMVTRAQLQSWNETLSFIEALERSLSAPKGPAQNPVARRLMANCKPDPEILNAHLSEAQQAILDAYPRQAVAMGMCVNRAREGALVIGPIGSEIVLLDPAKPEALILGRETIRGITKEEAWAKAVLKAHRGFKEEHEFGTPEEVEYIWKSMAL